MTKDIKVCKLCQSICDSYKVHFKAEHKPVKCEKCKKIFEGKRRLKNHQKTHQQQRCVKCQMLIVRNNFTKHKRNCNPVPTPSPIEDHVYQALKSSQDPSHDHAYCRTVSPGMRIEPGQYEMVAEDSEVTFTDVPGCDEAKKKLEDVVEFLISPDKLSALGGKLPNREQPPTGKKTWTKLFSNLGGSTQRYRFPTQISRAGRRSCSSI